MANENQTEPDLTTSNPDTNAPHTDRSSVGSSSDGFHDQLSIKSEGSMTDPALPLNPGAAAPASMPVPMVQPVLTPVQPQKHAPIVIPTQPGMPEPIVPKMVQGVSYPNDRITTGNEPLVPDAAAKKEADLAPKLGTPDDPSARK